MNLPQINQGQAVIDAVIRSGAIERMKAGRRKPYTAAGIRRMSCVRCGDPARHQWQICADGNLFRPICVKCDIALNRLVLNFVGDPDVTKKIVKYATQLHT